MHDTEAMPSLHERVASVLDRTGALDLAVRLRGVSPIPTVSIVTFHRIGDPDRDDLFDPEVVDASENQFRQHIETLARIGTPIDMATLIGGLDGKPLPKNPMMITFDDGYRSCRDLALPILRAAGVPATFFIATGFPDSGQLYWWEQIALAFRLTSLRRCELSYPVPMTIEVGDPAAARRTLDNIVKNTPGLDLARLLEELRLALDVPWTRDFEDALARQLIMGWDDIRALAAAGMDIGSHTRWHRVLETLDPAALEEELVGSRRDLERELGAKVRAFAYPVGRPPAPAVRRAVAAAGYEVAFTNTGGVNRLWPAWLRPTNAHELRRIETDRDSSAAMFRTQVLWPALAY